MTQMIRGSMVALAAAFALAGCLTPPAEPDYSATWPEPPPAPEQANGAIYQVGHDVALFENAVARRDRRHADDPLEREHQRFEELEHLDQQVDRAWHCRARLSPAARSP